MAGLKALFNIYHNFLDVRLSLHSIGLSFRRRYGSSTLLRSPPTWVTPCYNVNKVFFPQNMITVVVYTRRANSA